jgi:dolichol-phosphate mannosyltransferase
VSGVQLLMTGVLGEYMWRNLDETRRRPRFIVEHVVESRGVGEQPTTSVDAFQRAQAA